MNQGTKGLAQISKVLVVLALLSGCTTTRTRVVEEIPSGISERELIEAFGVPERIAPSNTIYGGTVYYYKHSGQTCGFVLDEAQEEMFVRSVQCGTDPNAVRKRKGV